MSVRVAVALLLCAAGTAEAGGLETAPAAATRAPVPATRCAAPEYVPPITTHVARRVMVRPETVEWRIEAALFETRRVRHLVRAERHVQVHVPALYETRDIPITEINNIPGRISEDEVFDKFGHPKTRRVRVLLKAAHTVTRIEPAVYRDEIVTVQTAPERRVRHVIPAVWRTIYDPIKVAPKKIIRRC